MLLRSLSTLPVAAMVVLLTPRGRLVVVTRDSDRNATTNVYGQDTGLSVYYVNVEMLGRGSTRARFGRLTTNVLEEYMADPSIAWAAGPRLYFAAQANPRTRNGGWGGMRIMRSDDCGETWVEDSIVPGNLGKLIETRACDASQFAAQDGCKGSAIGRAPNGCWCDVTPDMVQLFVDPYDYSQWLIGDFRTDANEEGRTAAYSYRMCRSDCTTRPEYGPWNVAGEFVDGTANRDHARIYDRAFASVPRGAWKGAASGGALAIAGVLGADVMLYVTLDRGRTVATTKVSDEHVHNGYLDSAPMVGSTGNAVGLAVGHPDFEGRSTVWLAWKSYINPADRNDHRSSLVLRRIRIDMSNPSALTFTHDPPIVRLPATDENQILFQDLIASDPRYVPAAAPHKYAMMLSILQTVPNTKKREDTKLRWRYAFNDGTLGDSWWAVQPTGIADWVPNGYGRCSGFYGDYTQGISFTRATATGTESAVSFLGMQPWSNDASFDRWDENGRSSLKYFALHPEPRTRAVAKQDYDGDRHAEKIVYRPSEGNWYWRPSEGGNDVVTQFGRTTDIPVPGDYDGDGRTDPAVFRPSEGKWYVHPSGGGADLVMTWGNATDRLAPGDYDGDGKTDAAIFRPDEGKWYVHPSGGGPNVETPFGVSTDRLVPDDYDGDGKTDLAVFRPSEGRWYVRRSGGGEDLVITWGGAADRLVPGDYDGDRKADAAVFRPSEGKWFVKPSGGGAAIETTWGSPGDLLVPADYDGDNKTDFGLYRPADGKWWIRLSSGFDAVTPFGRSTDIIPFSR